MRKRFLRSMMIILGLVLIPSYIIMSFIMYTREMNLLQTEIGREAQYIAAAINSTGSEYLEAMDEVDEDIRITRISADGDVLYDSGMQGENLENHLEREEVQEALADGVGEATRESSTMGQVLYYYALRLEDGSVLRIAKSMDSLGKTALLVLPLMGIVALFGIAAAAVLAYTQTKRLMQPVVSMDLEHPLDNDVYEELHPLLEAMDKQNREKEELLNVRREFSANVSHELKTPLTSISGYAEIMMNGLVRSQDMQQFSERIYKEARRLIVLVEDTIKLSRLDEGAVETEKEDVDMYDLTREIVGRLYVTAAERRIHMEVTGEHVTVHGIRQVLDEMVYNITENAVKYNNEGGHVTVWVGNTLSGPKVTVTDDGIGIPKESQERIFERFYRVDKSHSKERGGTGLGLSIVKHGAIIHNAKVNVISSPGKGTRMEIQFPKEET